MIPKRVQWLRPDRDDSRVDAKARIAEGWTPIDMQQRSFDEQQEYYAKFRDIYEWVKATAGVGGDDWICHNDIWCFRDANHALLFKLTWVGFV